MLDSLISNHPTIGTADTFLRVTDVRTERREDDLSGSGVIHHRLHDGVHELATSVIKRFGFVNDALKP
jgi:hypothetical protein